jgi:tRNA(His) guanylyltransferase
MLGRDIGREVYSSVKRFVSSPPVLSRLLMGGRKVLEPESEENATIDTPDAPYHEVTIPHAPEPSKGRKGKNESKPKTKISVLHCDIIKDQFWGARPSILAG